MIIDGEEVLVLRRVLCNVNEEPEAWLIGAHERQEQQLMFGDEGSVIDEDTGYYVRNRHRPLARDRRKIEVAMHFRWVVHERWRHRTTDNELCRSLFVFGTEDRISFEDPTRTEGETTSGESREYTRFYVRDIT